MRSELRWWLLAILLWALVLVLFKAQLRLEAREGESYVTRALVSDAGSNDGMNTYLHLNFPDGYGVTIAGEETAPFMRHLERRTRKRVRIVIEDVED